MKLSIPLRSLAATVALTLVTQPAGWAASPAPATPAPTISVSGNTLLANGRPWLPGGVNIVGLVRARPSPAGAGPVFDRAAAHFGPEELAAARSLGANVVLVQVSEPALDPVSPDYVPEYLDRVVAGIRLVQAAGFPVIVNMQWEKPTGVAGQPSMPGAETARAWARLGAFFAHDRSVVFELFNEPNLPLAGPGEPISSPRLWAAWQAAFQPLIDDLRRSGMQNVLIVDGMSWAQTLNGAPVLHDPLGQLAYGVHPYPIPSYPETPAGWDTRFGNFAQAHPVVITEWIADSGLFCIPDAPQVARSLLSYTWDHRIGFIGWAYDVPSSLVTSWNGPPTDYRDFACGAGHLNGPGLALQTLFLNRLPH